MGDTNDETWDGDVPAVLDAHSDDIAAEESSRPAETAADVELRMLESARAVFGDATRHDNLIYLPLHWLHRGPRALRGVQAVLVQRHRDRSFKGMYLSVEFWTRSRKTEPFRRTSRIHFEIDDTEHLLEYLHQAEASTGIQPGAYTLLPAAKVFDNLDTSQQQTFNEVLSEIARSRRVAELLSAGQLSPDTVENLAAATQHAKYKAALAELKAMVSGKVQSSPQGGGNVNEHEYQRWFERHSWAFGTEYLRRIDLRSIDPNATVDFILEAADGFFDVLELKKPSTLVLGFDRSHKTWYWSLEVAKVIAQAAKYLKAIERNADRIYRDENVALVRPRVRVVIGRSISWSQEQHEAFRRLAATLHGIDLMTFDHVMQRAQHLIDCYEQDQDIPTTVPQAD